MNGTCGTIGAGRPRDAANHGCYRVSSPSCLSFPSRACRGQVLTYCSLTTALNSSRRTHMNGTGGDAPPVGWRKPCPLRTVWAEVPTKFLLTFDVYCAYRTHRTGVRGGMRPGHGRQAPAWRPGLAELVPGMHPPQDHLADVLASFLRHPARYRRFWTCGPASATRDEDRSGCGREQAEPF